MTGGGRRRVPDAPGHHNGRVPVRRFRLRMSRLSRGIRTAVLLALGVCFVPAVVQASDLSSRVLSLVGLLSSVYGLRIVLGPAVEVRRTGIRILRNWPWHRDIDWYRIYEVEVVPGFWVLHLELNSGEHVELPCVEDVDDLFERIEELRHRLDA